MTSLTSGSSYAKSLESSDTDKNLKDGMLRTIASETSAGPQEELDVAGS